MTKYCGLCDKVLLDGNPVGFTGNGVFHPTESAVSYAIEPEFELETLFHPECLRRVVEVGLGGY